MKLIHDYLFNMNAIYLLHKSWKIILNPALYPRKNKTNKRHANWMGFWGDCGRIIIVFSPIHHAWITNWRIAGLHSGLLDILVTILNAYPSSKWFHSSSTFRFWELVLLYHHEFKIWSMKCLINLKLCGNPKIYSILWLKAKKNPSSSQVIANNFLFL